MHGGGSAPSCCAFTHRVAFKEVSGHRVLIKSGPGNRGLPPPARGPGTLIPSAQRLVWAAKQPLVEKTLESPLDCKEIQPVHPKGDQSCVFIGKTDVEAETPIL